LIVSRPKDDDPISRLLSGALLPPFDQARGFKSAQETADLSVVAAHLRRQGSVADPGHSNPGVVFVREVGQDRQQHELAVAEPQLAAVLQQVGVDGVVVPVRDLAPGRRLRTDAVAFPVLVSAPVFIYSRSTISTFHRVPFM
jgi:hypothetical protein